MRNAKQPAPDPPVETRECDFCGEESDAADFQELDGDAYCADCAGEQLSNCYVCSDLGRPDETGRSDEYGDWHCDECYCERYTTCAGCEYEILREYAMYDEYGENAYCETCWTDTSDRDVHDYGYKPDPIFHGDASKGMCGLELEVQCDSPEDVLEYREYRGEEYLYLKEDCSIDGSGFEIVTHPATVDVHREQFAGVFANADLDCDRSTGLHVTHNAKGLSKLQIARIVVFLADRRNRRFLENVIARRPARSGYARFDKPKTYGAVNEQYHDRQEALNLCKLRRSKLIEFRLFASTTDLQTLLACVEFTYALIEFCAPAKRSLQQRGMSLSQFKQFVRNNAKQYPDLAAHMSDYYRASAAAMSK